MKPFSDGVIDLSYKINETGIHHGCVEINDYPVVYDDKFYFSYKVLDRIRVLCVNNDKESVYLNALFGNDSSFVFLNASAKTIDYSALHTYNLIILNEFNDISSGLSNELSKYLKNGGSLLLIPGKDIIYESFNAFLSAMTQASLLKTDTQKVKINRLEFGHPLYKDVFEKIPDNIDLPDVRAYYVINAPSKSGGVNLLTLQNNNSYLSVFKVDKGTLYLIASPLGKEFTDFATHSIFVPTFYNIALNSAGTGNLFFTLGKDISFEVLKINNDYNEVYKIKKYDSDFEFIPQFSSAFSSYTFFINDQITEAGNYYIYNNKDTLGGVAFNYNRKESNMMCLSETDLAAKIKSSGRNDVFILDTRKETVSDAVVKINRGIVMWKYCIILALLFLMVEILLLRFWK